MSGAKVYLKRKQVKGDNRKESTACTAESHSGPNSVQPVGGSTDVRVKFPSLQIMCIGIELICSHAHVVNTHVHTQWVTIKFQEDDLYDLDETHNFPHWLAIFISRWLQVYFRPVSTYHSEELARTVSLYQLMCTKERQRILYSVDCTSRMVLKLGRFGQQIRNTWKVSKCDAGEGWRRSVGPIMWEMKKCYLESMSRGISYIK